MTKKILLSIAPVLAVAAFAVMPAFAQAETKAYGTCETGGVEEPLTCPKGEKKFTAFAVSTEVISQKAVGSGNFILKSGTNVIECQGFVDSGTDENVVGVGKSTDKLIFNHCFFVGTTNCPVNTPGAGAGVILASVTNKVKTETEVEITLPTAVEVVFSGPPPAGCPASGTAVGKITGSVVGTETKGSNDLVFNKTAGLLFNGAATELTGQNETYTKNTGKPVVIN